MPARSPSGPCSPAANFELRCRGRRVAGVPDAVAVEIALIRIEQRGTVVAGIAHLVAVGVGLPGVRHPRTVVVALPARAARAAVVGVLAVPIPIVEHAVSVE